MSTPNLREVAIDYLLAHQAEHLHPDRFRLASRCADHLAAKHGIPPHQANVIALQALGEIDSRGTAAHVDMSCSTSFAVFVVDPVAGVRTTFTAADLVRIARAQHAQSCGVRH